MPAVLDAVAERWWRTPPRMRLVIAAALAGVTLLLGVASLRPDTDTVPILVATRDLLPGDVVTDADITTAWWPSRLAPAGVVDEPHGVVAAPLPRGAAVTDRHLGDGGITEGLRPDRSAVAVEADLLPPLTAGARIDLVTADHDGRAAPLTRDVVVLGTDEAVVWVGVDADDADDVTAAAAAGRVAVVVRPW